MELTKSERNAEKAQDRFMTYGSFVNNKRAGSAFEYRSALALDFDHGAETLFAAFRNGDVLAPFAYVWHTTRSHTPEAPRLRVIIPLGRDVSRDEHETLVWVVALRFPATLDPGSVEADRIMYLPVQNEGAEFKHGAHEGEGYLNVDYWLSQSVARDAEERAVKPRNMLTRNDADPLLLKQPRGRWTLECVRGELLSKLDPNDETWDRKQWLKLGMILHHQGDGDPKWCEAWDDWSSKDERIDKDGGPMYQPGLCEKEWESFRNNRPDAVTIGTLVEWAQKGRLNVAALEAGATRFRLRSAAELANALPMPWLVRGVLPKEGLAALFGPSGSGKSFLALDAAAAVAAGAPEWFGRRVTQCPVTYCALEGEAGMSKRLMALAQHHGKPLPDALRFVTEPFNLLDPLDVDALARAIQSAGAPGGLVVLDTLNRAAPGADENSSVDMGSIISAAKRLQEWLGGLVLLVHHTGKDATKGLRGHSSLHAALDAAIEVSRAPGGNREWSVAKSKDDVDGGVHAFMLHEVNLGQDDHGDAISSCVVDSDGAMKGPARPQPQGAKQILVHKAVMQLLRASMDVDEGGASTGRLCIQLESAIGAASAELVDEDPRRRRSTAKRAIEAMKARGIYGISDGRLWAI
ncbi:AAA family ATPase [Caballeronia sp. Sq4a]|uniref:AAA family ATPase n=1 Tax=Caballeronia sp. Sq4a TaxID=2878152 RepID=UPI0020BFB52D|nr:AAA family ATPase [Caballeronia sp. Sq4a]